MPYHAPQLNWKFCSAYQGYLALSPLQSATSVLVWSRQTSLQSSARLDLYSFLEQQQIGTRTNKNGRQCLQNMRAICFFRELFF
jgi:hypothetical protein